MHPFSVGYKSVPEKIGGTIDDAYSGRAGATDAKIAGQLLVNAVLGWRYISPFRHGQQMQRHSKEQR